MAWFRSKEKLKEELREEFAEELRSLSFQDVWGAGGDASILRITTVQRALTCVPVFAATRLIADAIASLPMCVYRESGDEHQEIDTPMLLQDPTMFGGPYEWIQRCKTSLLLRGNAYGFITSFDYQGFPRQVEWLNPDEVTVDDDRTIARPKWRWLGREVPPWMGRGSSGQLIHIPWYVLPGHIMGLSPIQAFASTINAGIAAHDFGQGFFEDGGIPKAVLQTEHPVDGEQAKAIKDRFKAAVGNKRDVVVLGAGLQFNAMTVKPEEAQFLETIRATATEIAAIYGIYPAELIGGDTKDSMTYANTEQQSLNLVTHTLRPYLSKLEQALSTLLPRPQYVKFDLGELLRADQATRYANYKIGIETGFLARDEVREDEGRPPLTAAQKQELAKAPPTPAKPDGGSNVVPLPRVAGEYAVSRRQPCAVSGQ